MKKMIQDILSDLKNKGLKQAFKIHRWKLVLTIFMYYLVRDTLLYIVFPIFILGGCS